MKNLDPPICKEFFSTPTRIETLRIRKAAFDCVDRVTFYLCVKS